MNLDRFTTLAQQALADAQSVAVGRSHAELLPLHILVTLLDDQTGIAGSVIGKVGVDAARERAEELLATALVELEDLGEKAEPLRELVRFSVRRTV